MTNVLWSVANSTDPPPTQSTLKAHVTEAIMKFNNWAKRGIICEPKGVLINFLKKELIKCTRNLRVLKYIKSSLLTVELDAYKQVISVRLDTTTMYPTGSEQLYLGALNQIFKELGYSDIASRGQRENFEKRIDDIIWSIRAFDFRNTQYNK